MVSLAKSLALMLVFVLCSLLIVVSDVQAQPQTSVIWNIQTVDATSSGPIAMALDSNNKVHVLYRHYQNISNQSPFTLIHATKGSDGWNNEILPSEIKNSYNGYNIILDSNNSLHLAYTGLDGLKYAWWTGTYWKIETVTKDQAMFSYIALNSLGNPCITYTTNNFVNGYDSSSPSLLKYASWTGTNWTIQTIDKLNGNYNRIYLGLDSNDHPHILYANQTDYHLPLPEGGSYSLLTIKLANWNGTEWNIQTVLSGANAFGNLALDKEGNSHFVYRVDYPVSFLGNSSLYYASWIGVSWQFQPVISKTNLNEGSSYLALDSLDYPHIDYCNASGVNDEEITLMHSWFNGKDWSLQTVQPNSQAIDAGPIATDEGNNIYIIYTGYSTTNGFLRYSKSFFCIFAELSLYNLPSQSATASPEPNNLVTSKLSAIAVIMIAFLLVISILLYRRHRKTPKA